MALSRNQKQLVRLFLTNNCCSRYCIHNESSFSNQSIVPLKVSAFASATNDDSDDDSSLKDVSRVNSLLTRRSAASERAATKIYSDALAEDPSAFEYDDAYDSFKAVEVKSHALSQSNANNEAPVSSIR